MKKVLHLMTAVVLVFGITSISTSAYASENMTNTDYKQELKTEVQENLDALNRAIEVPVASTIQAAASSGVPRIIPQYIDIAPVYEQNGVKQISSKKYRFPKVNGSTAIYGDLSLEKQQELNDFVRKTYGCEPIGWSFKGAYYLDTYRAKSFQYYTFTEKGKSSLLGKRASNGYDNEFELICLYPQDTTNDYTYGIKGDVLYQNKSGNYISQVTMAIALQVKFKAQ